MPAIDKKYYDATRLATWGGLTTSTWGDCTYDWQSCIAPTYSEYTYTSTVADIGTTPGWVIPITTVKASGTDGDYPVTISYECSLDNSTWTAYSVGVLYGRYFRVVVTTAKDYLISIATEYRSATSSKSYSDLDTSTISGTIDDRDLPQSFSKIISVNSSASASTTKPIQLVVNDYTPSTFSFKLIDLDSWGKVSTDATINLLIQGLPNVSANATTGTVRVST